MSELNVWGRDTATIPAGQCQDCEAENPLHEDFCPIFDPFREETWA